MECLRSFLRRHLAEKPVVTSPNASRFSFFFLLSLDTTRTRLILPINHRANKRNGWARVCVFMYDYVGCNVLLRFSCFHFANIRFFRFYQREKRLTHIRRIACLNCGQFKRWGVLRLWAIFKVCFSVIFYA